MTPRATTDGAPASRSPATAATDAARGADAWAELLAEAEQDLLAFYAFPPDHWREIRSTNPLEQLNREIGRRTDVVGIFPNDATFVRLATSVVIKQNVEWLIGRRYLSAHSMETLFEEEKEEEQGEEVLELTGA